MSDLVEFLRARLAEDERAALAWRENRRSWQVVGKRSIRYDNGCSDSYEALDTTGETADYYEQIHVMRGNGQGGHIARHDPARVLREVEGKRRTIDRYVQQAARQGENAMEEDRAWTLEPVLLDLASAYADHPDYREEWRP